MLPDTNHLPAEAAKLAAYMAVALPVIGYFGIPKYLIAFWALEALRASVPKTAVHKYNNPFAPEGEIRFAEKWLVAPPTGDAVLPKYFNQAQFCCLVTARPDQ